MSTFTHQKIFQMSFLIFEAVATALPVIVLFFFGRGMWQADLIFGTLLLLIITSLIVLFLDRRLALRGLFVAGGTFAGLWMLYHLS